MVRAQIDYAFLQRQMIIRQLKIQKNKKRIDQLEELVLKCWDKVRKKPILIEQIKRLRRENLLLIQRNISLMELFD